MSGSDSVLNKREQDILTFIQKEIKTAGYPPSIREIGKAVGLKSSSTVHSYLKQLEQKGYIRRDPAKPRAIIPTETETIPVQEDFVQQLPLIGNVAAGSPILAEENIETYIPVPNDFIGHGTHYVLKVKGESMIEAGIMDGDYVIVRQQPTANNGEIVVAMINNEATVKRFYKRDQYIELRPENSEMRPILTRDVIILGKVSALMRRM